ncbi:unnamed protein product [Paramecium sonneborni]|uniref:Uncharacterized protein n=1 Tax=Paramecium sonneborni TaxID=65129 RepID=A0A8S1PKF5_9CILI|nr:unnamed protein product [Paramecium sonneborni]
MDENPNSFFESKIVFKIFEKCSFIKSSWNFMSLMIMNFRMQW